MSYLLAVRIKPRGIPARTEMYRFPTREAAKDAGHEMLMQIKSFAPNVSVSFAVAEEKPAKKRRK